MNGRIHLDISGNIGWLILDRPTRRNAIRYDMWLAIPGLLQQAIENPAVKMLILKSATPGIFSAGADIEELQTMRDDRTLREANRAAIMAAEQALADFPKPSLAMIEGACVGGGCILAAPCDFRFVVAGAKMGITPARLGVVYGIQTTARLVELVGLSAAKDILFTGRLFDAAEAHAMGLVDRVFDAGDILSSTLAFADQVADNSQTAIRAMKQVFRRVAQGVCSDDADSRKWFIEAYDSDDYREGVRAFLEKRPPRFTD